MDMWTIGVADRLRLRPHPHRHSGSRRYSPSAASPRKTAAAPAGIAGETPAVRIAGQLGGFIVTSSITLGRISRSTPRGVASLEAVAAAISRREPRRRMRAETRPSRPGRIVANASAGSTRRNDFFSSSSPSRVSRHGPADRPRHRPHWLRGRTERSRDRSRTTSNG
jgi:hypothetical protein